jgi:hypothetical protein
MKKLLCLIAFIYCLCLGIILLGTITAHAGKVTKVTWDAPTTNADGSPLDDLAGYKVNCAPNISVDVGNVTFANISGIITSDGLFPCHVTAYDVWNNESVPSNIVEVLRRNGNFFKRDDVAPNAPLNVNAN